MSTAMPDWLPRHRITVDEYHQMAAVGLLAPDARVELIEGEIIEMPPIGSFHAATVHALRDLLDAGVNRQASVRVQSPIQLGQSSEPEPDLAVVVRRDDYYASSLGNGPACTLSTRSAVERHDRSDWHPGSRRWRAELCLAQTGIPRE
jgi:Uma2 family endonuclease